MVAVPIRKGNIAPPILAIPKEVEGNQKSIDALPLNSGMWKVRGESGLYVRCRVASKSFMLQRRIDGDLVKVMLGQVSVKDARDAAKKQWGTIGNKPAAMDGVLKLGAAIEAYIEARMDAAKMAEKTAAIARYNAKRYLIKWKDRSLRELGANPLGVRIFQQQVTKKHGRSTSNQCVRLLAAVYRWHREVDGSLPEWPRKAAELHTIKPRDWAYSSDDLRGWWHTVVTEKGKRDVHKGVSTLGAIKRMWWLTALFTGARKGSIEAMQWEDVNLDKKVITFRVTKGDKPYSVPMADTLAELLTRYRDTGDVPPSQWLFPSSVRDGQHIVGVKNDKEGAGPAHRLRHTYRTTLAQLGASPDQARMLMGHSMGGDVSRGYISAPLVVESLRPVVNAIAERYNDILKLTGER